MTQVHISIAAEKVAEIGSFAVTNSLLTTWVVAGVIGLLAIKTYSSVRLVPGNWQAVTEMPVEYLMSLAESILGEKWKKYFGLVLTFFIFILLSNWSGLIPGVGTIGVHEAGEAGEKLIPLFRAPTADLNMTLALAIVSVIVIQAAGFTELGLGYLKKFFNFSNPIFTFSGILELVSEISKLISFAFRLFGNVFAGEVLLVITSALVPLLIPVPFYGLEIFVGLIQAFVFSMLTMVFIGIATSHSEH